MMTLLVKLLGLHSNRIRVCYFHFHRDILYFYCLMSAATLFFDTTLQTAGGCCSFDDARRALRTPRQSSEKV